MTQIGTTTKNEVIVTLTIDELRDILLFLNSAEIRYREKDFNRAMKECSEMQKKLFDIWDVVK